MSTKWHPLYTDIEKPQRFTWPFCYEPHPLCLLATEEVRREVARINPSEGKMFGVLVVERTTDEGPALGFLAAYSGLLEGRNDWPYFVPPVFDAQQPDGHFKQTEQAISALNHTIATMTDQTDSGELKTLRDRRRQLSEELQQWLFHQYQLLNARGETRDLVDIWHDYHASPRIQKKFPLPPGGTGDCCAPKLLQYAYRHAMHPVCMAEFWWGDSPRSDKPHTDHESGLIRHHGQFYPACQGKCKPVLSWMLQGLLVDPDPEKSQRPQEEPVTIYDDDSIAVLNKPAGLLSVPGKNETHSVATWAQKRWPGAVPVHRLDQATSGLIIVAKTAEAYRLLQEQFTARTIRKKYIALVEGIPASPHGIIDLPLRPDPVNRPRQVVDHIHGKRAITEYRLLSDQTCGQSPSGTPRSLLALWPHTGRTHQLRMHCAHPEGLGCPIVGDALYGRQADRLYLQAQSVSFIHPVTGQRLHFELNDTFFT